MGAKLYVGVLAGAGPQISRTSRDAISKLIESIFLKAQDALENVDNLDSIDLLDLGNELMASLEESEHTNAGRGSELTLDGTIECDASAILSTNSNYTVASAGAVPNIGNPSALCTELIKRQLRCASGEKATRSIPNFLVGCGARKYGERLGIFDPESSIQSNFITERAKRSYEKWSLYESLNAPGTQDLINADVDKFIDTVGLIILYGDSTYVASSSGGALLKDSGRIGPAALVGCGLDTKDGISAVCSGFGEDIISCRLASKAVTPGVEISEAASHLCPVTIQRPPAQFGILRASRSDPEESEDSVYFEWSHTTPSMICGYCCVTPQQPHMSRINISKRPAQGGYKF